MKQFLVIVLLILLMVSISKADPEYDSVDNSTTTTTTTKTNMDTTEFHHVKPFSLTPSVNLLSFPHELDGSLEMVFSERFGIKYSHGLNFNGTIDNNHVSLDNQLLALRAYPNQGAWFLGIGFGHHEVNAHRTDTINGFETTTYAQIKSDYISPTTGYKWVYESGITIGVEIGWIFATNGVSTTLSSNQDANPFVTGDPDYSRRRRDAEDSISSYVNNGTITIGLFELGYTF